MLVPRLILIFQARGSCCCAAGLGTDAARVKPKWREARLLCLPELDEPTTAAALRDRLRKEREKKGNSSPHNADEWKSEKR